MSKAKPAARRSGAGRGSKKAGGSSFGDLSARVVKAALRPEAFRAYTTVVAIGLVYVLGVAFYDHVTSLPRYQVDIGELRIVDRPEWLPASISGEITVPPEMAGTYSIFDPELVPRVALGFVANPWVRKVGEVRKEYPATIHIALDLRRPVGHVHLDGFYYLIDREGVRLPGVYLGEPARLPDQLPIVVGGRVPPPAAGSVWHDRGIREGAIVGEILLNSSVLRSLSIERIDVSNIQGRIDPRRGEITLQTAHGTRIVWGRSDLSNHVKLSSEKRLEILESHLEEGLLARHPELRGIEEIEIRFGQPIIRR